MTMAARPIRCERSIRFGRFDDRSIDSQIWSDIVTRACWATLFVALAFGAANAQTAMYSLGIGRLTCAYWLSTPEREADGRSWALGFWTAYNAVNEVNHTVGLRTKTEDIFGEVKKVCVSEPSLGLVDAVVRVYVRFFQGGA